MKKILSILGVVFLATIFFGNIANAQGVADMIKNGQPLEVVIKGASFDGDKNQINLDVDISNNTDDFISGINSTLSVYKGDALKAEGYLFEGLELTYNTGGEIQDLSPKERVSLSFSYDLPKNLETGKYFIQYGMTDRELRYHGINYYDKPIEISGAGGFIGDINAFVRASGEDQPLAAGQLLGIDQEISVVIPLSENTELQKRLKGDSLFAKASVRSISSGEILKELEKIKIITNSDGEIVYNVKPWEGMPTGTMTIILDITDGNNEKVANEIFARWFIAERVSRVVKIETGTNYYKKGDSIDLSVIGSFLRFNDGDKFLVSVDLITDNSVQKLEKEYIFSEDSSEEISFDFSDQETSEEGMLQSISVSIKDMKTGEIKDEYTRHLKQDKVFVDGKEVGAGEKKSIFAGKNIWQIMIIFAIIPLIVIVTVLFFRKKITLSVFVLFILAGLMGGLFFLNVDNAEAVVCPAPGSICGGSFTPNTIWASASSASSGNLGTCSKDIVVSGVYAHMSCASCLNGVHGYVGLEVQRANGSAVGSTCQYLGDPGHKYHWKSVGDPLRYIPPGPYTLRYTLNNPGSYRYRVVMNSAAGCKCFADSWSTGWTSVNCSAPPAPTCSISFNPSSVDITGGKIKLPSDIVKWTINTSNDTTKTSINCTGAESSSKVHNFSVNGTWPFWISKTGDTNCSVTVNGPGGQGNCSASLSVSECGNGVKEGSEDCDDGNSVDTDSCSNSCKTIYSCNVPNGLDLTGAIPCPYYSFGLDNNKTDIDLVSSCSGKGLEQCKYYCDAANGYTYNAATDSCDAPCSANLTYTCDTAGVPYDCTGKCGIQSGAGLNSCDVESDNKGCVGDSTTTPAICEENNGPGTCPVTRDVDCGACSPGGNQDVTNWIEVPANQ